MVPPTRLLFTDLDRTLIPNGAQPESQGVRERFRAWVEQPEVMLVYVTGRSKALVQEAISTYRLPWPNAVITDVGTTVYDLRRGEWQASQVWQSHMAQAWQGKTGLDLHHWLDDQPALTLQEADRQTDYKLSYYVALENDLNQVSQEVTQRLTAANLQATIITSIDEAGGVGLLDILPPQASKLQAIEFWMAQVGHGPATTLFAGDSGNDLTVLVSPIPSVLVANAHPDVKRSAQHQAQANGNGNRLYIAQGNAWGMNGNYSAGILEGAAHYFPEVTSWLSNNP